MATRKALGRGLSALIPPSATGRAEPERPAADQAAPPPAGAVRGGAEITSQQALQVRIERIAPNPDQPRKRFAEQELASLSASIREQGVLQPLVVRRRGDEGFELIIGERRWRAAQLAGLDTVPAVVLDASDRAVVEMALVENVQRQDLNPMELAQAFHVLVDQESMTQDEVGKRVGLDRSTVANHLRILELPSSLQQDLIDQRLTMGHAKALLAVPDAQRPMLRDQILRGGLSVRAAEELARRIVARPLEPAPDAGPTGAGAKSPRGGPRRDPDVVALEEQLRRALQTRVRIVGQRGRGRIELHYYGAGELDRLTDTLLGGSS